MKLYFIRHAPTLANLSGSMVQNYDQTEILPLTQEDVDLWQERVGKHINYIWTRVYYSPTVRALQTANTILCRGINYQISSIGVEQQQLDELKEFDCHGLGDKKFWEISKDEFTKLVPDVTSQSMAYQAGILDAKLRNSGMSNCVCVSHGMLIRYMFHYYTGRKNVHPYDIINSKDFKFSHLDMMEYDTTALRIKVYRFKEPIDHKESK